MDEGDERFPDISFVDTPEAPTSVHIPAEQADWEPVGVSPTKEQERDFVKEIFSSGSVSALDGGKKKKTRKSKKKVHADEKKATSWAKQALRNIYTTASPRDFIDTAPDLVFFDPVNLPADEVMAGILGEQGNVFVCFFIFEFVFCSVSYIFLFKGLGIILVHNFSNAARIKNRLNKAILLQHLFCYTIIRKISARVDKAKTLKKPLNNCSFMHLFASSRYTSTWYTCKAGSIMERSGFFADIPRHDELPKCKGTGFNSKTLISYTTWEKVLDGLGMEKDHLVLDLNPGFGEFI